ncbi:MAG: M48 family metalloprotease [Sphingopyxis sp.]|uniref:M48 family metalloprotease n=1 Tax=Sphingopyxis sp. TaxID=1908224 RepID=UPI001A1C8056|nr:M48 family metalloprotease [Sphingopyxis sp.]MBJ7502081.1 M48 family metalloprotease [Sphingopyxis sp.]
MQKLAALIAAAALALSPVAAAAKGGRAAFYAALAEQETRLAAIAHRLTTASARWCPALTPQPGWILGDLRQFPNGDRGAASEIYGDADGPFIAAVAPGSPAERAGLTRGTRIAAINGDAILPAGDGPTIRIDTALVKLYTLDPAAAWTITGADGRLYHIAPAPGCASAFRIELRGAQAAANGILVRVTQKLARSIAEDDELAAVVAHELAHNILRHRDRLGGDRSAARIRQTEFEADRLAVWLMADAGYDPAAAIRFWQRHKRPLIRAASHPPRSERIVAIKAEMTAMTAARAASITARPSLVDAVPPLE